MSESKRRCASTSRRLEVSFETRPSGALLTMRAATKILAQCRDGLGDVGQGALRGFLTEPDRLVGAVEIE